MHRTCDIFIQDLAGKLEYKTPLGRPRYKWKDNIKNDHKEI
jgi:hypothetical protein